MSMTPWKKLDNLSFSLIRKILLHEPSHRFKISHIKKHPWFVNKFSQGMIFFIDNIFILFFGNIICSLYTIIIKTLISYP